MVALIAVCLGTAEAGPFTQKTTQGALPDTEAEAQLVLPKGWLELGLRVDSKTSGHQRNGAGDRRPHGATWRYSRLWLDVRQGFSSRVTLYGAMPWVMAELDPVAGTTTRTVAMGDAEVGLIAQPWRWDRAGLGIELAMKMPSGVEWPGTVSNGPDQVESFLTGTGTTNAGAHILARARPVDRLRVDLALGYVAKLPGVVGYVVQDDGFGNGWLDPGDELRVRAALTVQVLSSLSMDVGSTWSRRGTYEMGVSGPSTTGRVMSPIADPGAFLDGRAGIAWQATEHWGLHAHGARDLMGSDTRTFAHLGLEEFSPQPGLELGLGLRARW
jgi:hypothetical protein